MESEVGVCRRVALRPWLETDAEVLFALAGDPVVGRLAGFPPHGDVEDSRRVIRDILAKQGALAIVSREENAVVGCVSALPVRRESSGLAAGEWEIGYWIGRRHWNRGFATAAVSAFCRRCFAEPGFGCRRLFGRVREENAASRRVLEKCGFKFQVKVKDCDVFTFEATSASVKSGGSLCFPQQIVSQRIIRFLL